MMPQPLCLLQQCVMHLLFSLRKAYTASGENVCKSSLMDRDAAL